MDELGEKLLIIDDLMAEKYGYLLVDLSPHSDPKYKLRTHVLPNQLIHRGSDFDYFN